MRLSHVWLPRLLLILFLGQPLPVAYAKSNEPHWIRIHSSHFSILTDADITKAQEAVVRFEQLRAVFGQLLMKTRLNIPEPIDIIAFRSNEEFSKVAPAAPDPAIARGAFFLPGDDRVYFVLDLSKGDSWRGISRQFAQFFLNYNYPPAQPWFDAGFTEYFSSLRLTASQMQLGEDPASFLASLDDAHWLSLTDLFGTSQTDATKQPVVFGAESWLVMHYLLSQDKLSETGTYLGLVETQKLAIPDAIQKAYGVSAAQLEQVVKDHLHSLASAAKSQPASLSQSSAAPATADQIGSNTDPVPLPTAQALVAEMSLRVPEHRDQAHSDLNELTNDPKDDTAILHRALGWELMQKKDFDGAIDELARALTLDAQDPWTHYYLAVWKYREAQGSGEATKGLANMMQDLHIVLNWDREVAEAYAMLAMAQMEGGGVHAATDSIHAAMQLAPRNQTYLLDLAKIYLAGKNWDAATAMLERLSNNPNPEVAAGARQNLHDLPFLKKYGVPPKEEAASPAVPKPASSGLPPAQASAVAPKPAGTKSTSAKTPAPAEDSDENSDQAPATPAIDRRPIQYVKGKLISVDCSQNPAAVLTVSVGGKNLTLHTADYKSLTLVGADQFSCAWSNRSVAANYKATNKVEGDLVSLELY